MSEATDEDLATRLTLVERTVDGVKQDVSLMKAEAKTSHGEVMAAIAAMNDASALGSRIKAAAGYCGAVLAIGVFVGTIVAFSPAVRDLDARLTKLDDKDVGRVGKIEALLGKIEILEIRVVEQVTSHASRLGQLEASERRTTDALGWRPTIARAKD